MNVNPHIGQVLEAARSAQESLTKLHASNQSRAAELAQQRPAGRGPEAESSSQTQAQP